MKKILKIVFIVIVIIAVLIMAWQLSLFVRVRNIEKKTFDNFKGDYYYKVSNNENVETEYWVNDDYIKIQYNGSVTSFQDKKKNIFVTLGAGQDAYVKYLEDGEKPYMYDMFDKTARSSFNDITSWSWEYNVKGMLSLDGNLLSNIYGAFYSAIAYPITSVKSITTEIVNGKECYKIEMRGNKHYSTTYYLEKGTCLPIRVVEKYVSDMLEEGDIRVQEYEYSFEPLSNESLELPNFDDFYVVITDM